MTTDELMLGLLREIEPEIARTIADIIGARQENCLGTADPRFDVVSQQELAHLEGLLARIRSAIALVSFGNKLKDRGHG